MKIKCPECSTGYNIPDATLGGKPRKMKCAKCKNIFTVARRSEHPPAGYEEFSGGGGLPPEFAFLKASVPPNATAAPNIPNVTPGGTFVGHPPSGPPSLAPIPVAVPDNNKTVIGRPAPVVPASGAAVEAPQEPDAPVSTPEAPPAAPGEPAAAPSAPSGGAAMPNFPAEALEQAKSPAAKAAVEEMRQGGAIPVRNSMPAENMFGASSASAWEVEAPMELGNYEVTSETPPPHSHEMAGKIVFGVIVFLIVFFFFVAFRNGWSLSLSGLPEQIGFAFSGESLEEIPEAAENIGTTVVTKKVLTSPKGAYLIVSGEVTNSNPGSRSNVIVQGKLFDGAGDTRAEARMPCGMAVEEKVIRRTPPGSVKQHFIVNGQLYNCQIGPNDNRLFQVIFDTLPPDYDAGFDVKIRVVAATAP